MIALQTLDVKYRVYPQTEGVKMDLTQPFKVGLDEYGETLHKTCGPVLRA